MLEMKAPAARDVKAVVFTLGKVRYGINIEQVREINKLPEITPMPGTLDFIEGIINLRGAIVPVLDLRKRFNLPAVSATAATRVVVLELPAAAGAMLFGIIVDTLDQVVTLPAGAIQPPPRLASGLKSDYLTGIGNHQGTLILLVDINRILSSEERELMQTVAPA